MNHRRDEQYARQQFGRQNRELEDERSGQDDWRSNSQRTQDEDWRGHLRGGEGGRFEQQGRVGGGLRGGRESYGYEGVGGYGYGEGMRGGYSYAQNPSGGMRYPNEGLANDFSLEGTRSFSRDEHRSNARGYGVNSAFENEGHVRVSHRGKGPKGFKRSDDRVREDVSQALSDHHDIDASDIEVLVKDGEVTLTGTVDARRTKQLAERVIEHLSGVIDVHNQLRVAKAGDKTDAAQPSTNGRAAPVSRPH